MHGQSEIRVPEVLSSHRVSDAIQRVEYIIKTINTIITQFIHIYIYIYIYQWSRCTIFIIQIKNVSLYSSHNCWKQLWVTATQRYKSSVDFLLFLNSLPSNNMQIKHNTIVVLT